MATLQEIVYNLRNLRKGGRISDDDTPSDRQWAFIVNYYRAKLIKQDAQKLKTLSGNIIQNLGKVPVQKADKNECCDIRDCIIRITNPLPKAIDTDDQTLITFVGQVNQNKTWQRTTVEKIIYEKHSKYTGGLTKWYELDKYIYIINPPTLNLKYINIQGIFEDPTAALRYRTCDCPDNEELCFEGFNYEYPLALDKLDTLYKMIAEAEMKITLVADEDTSNNTTDEEK